MVLFTATLFCLCAITTTATGDDDVGDLKNSTQQITSQVSKNEELDLRSFPGQSLVSKFMVESPTPEGHPLWHYDSPVEPEVGQPNGYGPHRVQPSRNLNYADTALKNYKPTSDFVPKGVMQPNAYRPNSLQLTPSYNPNYDAFKSYEPRSDSVHEEPQGNWLRRYLKKFLSKLAKIGNTRRSSEDVIVSPQDLEEEDRSFDDTEQAPPQYVRQYEPHMPIWGRPSVHGVYGAHGTSGQLGDYGITRRRIGVHRPLPGRPSFNRPLPGFNRPVSGFMPPDDYEDPMP